MVLVCVGRREYRDGLGTEDLGIEMEGKKIKATRCNAVEPMDIGGSENPWNF